MSRGEPLIRQWNLIKTLQAHYYGVSANELAQRLECSKRQVQRDLNILQQVGFPIYYQERDFGKRFWKLSPHFLEGKDMIFSVTEVLSLYLSQQLLAPLSGTQLGDGVNTLLDKIKALLPRKALTYFKQLDGAILVKNIAAQDYSRHDKKIQILNQAVMEGRVVKLCYQSASKKKPYETLYHPYGMIFFENNLYCVGYMDEYQEIRTLKINRICSSELTRERFKRPADFSLQGYTQGSFGIFSPGKPQKVRVRFTGWGATLVREQKYHVSQKITKDKLIPLKTMKRLLTKSN